MCSVYSRVSLDALHEERLPTMSQGPRSERMNLPAAQHTISLPLLNISWILKKQRHYQNTETYDRQHNLIKDRVSLKLKILSSFIQANAILPLYHFFLCWAQNMSQRWRCKGVCTKSEFNRGYEFTFPYPQAWTHPIEWQDMLHWVAKHSEKWLLSIGATKKPGLKCNYLLTLKSSWTWQWSLKHTYCRNQVSLYTKILYCLFLDISMPGEIHKAKWFNR